MECRSTTKAGWVRTISEWIAAAAVFVALVVTGHWYVSGSPAGGYDVYLSDMRIGSTADPEPVRQWRVERYRELAQAYPGMEIQTSLTGLHWVEGATSELMETGALLAQLESRLDIRLLAAELRVDGQSIGFVRDPETAFLVLSEVKAPYVQGAEEVSSSFVEQVELRMAKAEPGALQTEEELLAQLTREKEAALTYTVQRGDCLSLIAEKEGTTLDRLRRDNPQIRGDRIRVGEVLVLSKPQPLLNVKTTARSTERKSIPYDVRYVDDDSLAPGVEQTESPGREGWERADYETVSQNGQILQVRHTGSTIEQEPAAAVIRRGTGGVETGGIRFAMPVLHAEVSSKFGLRWGRQHSGVDFVSEERHILAAAQGTVTFSGWKSGYGYCIIIDHGGGFETLYGHLSKRGVRKGAKVAKGAKIGVMGSTGNSTGVHLHFEIIRGGEQQNPQQYLPKTIGQPSSGAG